MNFSSDQILTENEQENAQNIDRLAQHMAEQILSDIPEQEFLLESKKNKKARIEKEIKTQIEEAKRAISLGCKSMLDMYVQRNKNASKEEQEAFIKDIEKLGEQKHPEKFKEALENKKSLQEFYGISSSTIEELYQSAKALYENKLLEEAVGAFCFLTLLVPENYTFWMAHACSHFLLEHYEQAIEAFSIAGYINPFDPTCHIYSSRCCEALHDRERAVQFLELALFTLEEAEDQAQLKNFVHQEIERIQNLGA